MKKDKNFKTLIEFGLSCYHALDKKYSIYNQLNSSPWDVLKKKSKLKGDKL